MRLSGFVRTVRGTLLAGAASVLWNLALPAAGAVPFPGLNNPGVQIGEVQSATDGQGGALIAWVQDGYLYAQSVGADSRPRWQHGGVLVHLVGTFVDVKIAPDGNRGALLAWKIGSNCWMGRISSTGRVIWVSQAFLHEQLQQLTNNAFSDYNMLELVPDGTGGGILAASAAGEVVLTRLNGATGTPAWTPGMKLLDLYDVGNFPDAESDRAGGMIVVWQNGWDYNPDRDTGIFAQRISPNGELMWGAEGIPVCRDAAASQFHPRVSASADGSSFHVAWIDERLIAEANGVGGELRAFAQRLDASGQPQWGLNGVTVLSSGAHFHAYPASDGPEAVIVLESFLHQSPLRIQRLSASGAPKWGNTGSDAGSSDSFRFAPDGHSGAILGRRVPTDGNQDDVIAQRYVADGQTAWGAGIRAAASPTGETLVGLVPDGNGGALVVWKVGEEAVCARPIPTLRADINSRQAVQVRSDGSAWQIVTYDYLRHVPQIGPVHVTDGQELFNLAPWRPVGLFLYDYGTGRFSEGDYLAREYLN